MHVKHFINKKKVAVEYWKHARKFLKKQFNKKLRQDSKNYCKEEK